MVAIDSAKFDESKPISFFMDYSWEIRGKLLRHDSKRRVLVLPHEGINGHKSAR